MKCYVVIKWFDEFFLDDGIEDVLVFGNKKALNDAGFSKYGGKGYDVWKLELEE